MHALEQTPLLPYLCVLNGCPDTQISKRPLESAYYISRSQVLSFENSPVKIDVSVLQNKAWKACLKSDIQKLSNLIDK